MTRKKNKTYRVIKTKKKEKKKERDKLKHVKFAFLPV
jgi:hypothetical protein